VNLPNVISLGRLLAVPLIVWLIVVGNWLWAFAVFCLAGASDAVDGFIAKRFDAQTRLGRYLDPIADKSLLVAIYVALGVQDQLPAWLVILVVSRDLLIVGGALLLYALNHRHEPTPLLSSKVNTAAQIALAALVLAKLAFAWPLFDALLMPLIVAVALTTTLSGAAYLVAWGRQMNRMEEPPL